MFSWGTWALVTALFAAALLNSTAQTSKERLVFAPIALALGVLALLVARSPRP
jgi:anaerobic C4-dicarboxylate transporter